MKDKIRMELPTPCHERWDAMTPTEQGRHCQSCRKTVVDFTQMTDREIIGYMSLYAGADVCGRLNESQLGRVIQTPPERKPVPRYFWSLALTSLLMCYRSVAQQVRPLKEKATGIAIGGDTTKPNQTIRIGKVAAGHVTEQVIAEIQGRVVNEQGEPVPYASIGLTNPQRVIAADSNGVYAFSIPMNQFPAVEMGISSAGGYNSLPSAVIRPDSIRSIEIEKNKHPQVTISMKDFVLAKKSLEQVVVIGYATHKHCWTTGAVLVSRPEYASPKPDVKMPEKKQANIWEKVQGVLGRSHLIVYPNPAPVNGSFRLQFNMKQAGEYNVQFIDVSGRIVGGKRVMISSAGQTESFDGSQLPGRGAYFVRVAGRVDGKVYDTKVIVQ